MGLKGIADPKRTREVLADSLFEAAGGLLISLAVHNVALGGAFPLSGFSGIALILYRLCQLPMGLTIIILNIPVAVLCGRRLGRRFLLKTIRCMVISSVLLDYVAPLFPAYTGERLVAALLTGVMLGVGYALIYLRGSSTGGLDFIVLSIKSLRPHMQVGTITLVLDCAIIALTGLIFGDFDSVVYGMIINFLVATVINQVILGLNAGNVALIVTEHGGRIAELVDAVSMRGSTLWKAYGGYRGEGKEIVMTAGTGKDLYRIIRAVREAEPSAFVIVLDSREVHGEGFRVAKVAGE